MNYRLMFTLNAIVAAVTGVLFVAAPSFFLTMFGFFDASVATQVVTRFYGGALAVTAVFIWLLSNIPATQKNTAITLMVASAGGFILTLLGMFMYKVIRTNGWILVLAFLLFTVGYAYLVFRVSVKVKGVKK
jgi:hypothetical protein